MTAQRCAIYTRQSRESRSEFTSCDAQHKICFVFAVSMQREGWQLVDRRYDDVGQSSETLDRPALNRLVDDIRAGNIDRVLVHRLDRIARKILYACQFLEMLRQDDVAITIVSQPELTDDANGRLLINLLASFAEFEQEMTKQRSRLMVVELPGACRMGTLLTPLPSN
jgi:site-specific DNA recombinase